MTVACGVSSLFVGSDKTNEFPTPALSVETAAPIDGLRFALATKKQWADQIRSNIKNNESYPVITEYPITATSNLGFNVGRSATGKSEGLLNYLYARGYGATAGFFLVKSGKTLLANELEIIEDDIEQVTLNMANSAIFPDEEYSELEEIRCYRAYLIKNLLMSKSNSV